MSPALRDQARYNLARPPWPVATVSWLLGSPDPATPLRVLDLGSGTGSGARTAACLGHTVLAVDPSADMLAALDQSNRKLPAHVGARITTARGTAENLPAADGSIDAILCLQSWQWVSVTEAAGECLRVLAPGGSLAMAWHTWDRSVPWVCELADIVGHTAAPPPHGTTLPHGVSGLGKFEQRNFHVAFQLTLDQFVELADSWSYVHQRPDRAAVLERVRALGRNQVGPTGTLEFPHVTECYRAVTHSRQEWSNP
ncbi:class I SAM-dependent methyltransferase [Arthrobacter sp. A2-55]|uniref:class I SAM-dependent methyltransferase n=1 Tax=Arthrobacter sp. A2-55 TaxID=2897337 RepID=UPI0021CD9CD5|nr:class I SAM-dependent methyltransferase [Arthrobacter sp. A2-55]MCU6480691.1 class I SAM-dependent methyltransferase [Arthrobacter sp. A2-55]